MSVKGVFLSISIEEKLHFIQELQGSNLTFKGHNNWIPPDPLLRNFDTILGTNNEPLRPFTAKAVAFECKFRWPASKEIRYKAPRRVTRG